MAGPGRRVRAPASGTQRPLGAAGALQRQARPRRRVARREPSLDVFDAAAVGRVRGLEALLAGDAELARPGRRTVSPRSTTRRSSARRSRRAPAREWSRSRWRGNENIHVTPLHSAAAGGHVELVRLLLEHGADPNGAGRHATPSTWRLRTTIVRASRRCSRPEPTRRARPTRARPADLAGDVRDLPRLRSARAGYPTDQRHSGDGHR